MLKKRLTKLILVFTTLIILSTVIYFYYIKSIQPDAVVKDYVHALLRVYRNLDFKEIGRFTAMEQHYEDLNEIEGYKKDKVFMEPKLVAFKIAYKKTEKQSAVVITSEEWIYRLVSSKTKKVVQPDREVLYRLTYHLKRDYLYGWVITKIDSIGYDLGSPAKSAKSIQH